MEAPCLVKNFLKDKRVTKEIDNAQNVLYEGQKFRIVQTTEFSLWLPSLRDIRASAKITDRLFRAADGNFGDVKSAGGGISEMRIDYGPGYRVYFCQRGSEIVILLCGGDKRTQQSDITRAKRLKLGLDNGL
jgi:putative addiction module killer protein